MKGVLVQRPNSIDTIMQYLPCLAKKVSYFCTLSLFFNAFKIETCFGLYDTRTNPHMHALIDTMSTWAYTLSLKDTYISGHVLL